MTNYREILQAISQRLGCANTSLPLEDRDSLLEQLQQPIEQQRNEIAANGERVCYIFKDREGIFCTFVPNREVNA